VAIGLRTMVRVRVRYSPLVQCIIKCNQCIGVPVIVLLSCAQICDVLINNIKNDLTFLYQSTVVSLSENDFVYMLNFL